MLSVLGKNEALLLLEYGLQNRSDPRRCAVKQNANAVDLCRKNAEIGTAVQLVLQRYKG